MILVVDIRRKVFIVVIYRFIYLYEKPITTV